MYAQLTLLLDSPTYFITIKKSLIKVLQNTIMNGKKDYMFLVLSFKINLQSL